MRMHIPEHVLPLIEKFLSGTITADEKKILNDWYRQVDDTAIDLTETDILTEQQLSERIKQRLQYTIINGRINRSRTIKPLYKRLRIPAVAALLLLVATASIIWYNNQRKEPSTTAAVEEPIVVPADLAPGSTKAILQFDDGKKIELDDAQNGVLALEGNSIIQKTNTGKLQYLNGKGTIAKVHYNTVSTPRGGEYQVTLADGTKVWLNAASSIRFPTAFTANNRLVEITGEVYFEVTKNPHQPFIVRAGKTEIEVLGTHFNVNAYDDEAQVKTSLLEGSIKLSATTGSSDWKSIHYLKPGSQARVEKNGAVEIVGDIDTEEVMAWKNNLFIFKSTDLRTIMRQISRWYDVDIQYKGNVNLTFTGQITRNSNVSKVFEKLKLTGMVDFTLADKKIVVTKSK